MLGGSHSSSIGEQLWTWLHGSQDDTSVVRFGFEAVKTVGSSISQALIDKRDARGLYRSIVDLINRADLRELNKRAIAALIQAGAFDELHPNRRIQLEKSDDMLRLRRKLRDQRKRWENKKLTIERYGRTNGAGKNVMGGARD
ncbi:DNA polymerase III alpha subunit [Gracilaria domingensis]|nr:DNA polymerase III alpha subunit [Gracilaria domingensis]